MNIRKSINNVLRRYGYSLEHYDEVGGLSFGLYQYRHNAGGFDYGVRRILQTPTKGRYHRSHGIVIQRFAKPEVSARPRVPDTASRAT